MGKADALKRGASRTGKGLFNGMSSLSSSREDETAKKIEKSTAVKKVEEPAEPEEEIIDPVVEEKTDKIDDSVKKEAVVTEVSAKKQEIKEAAQIPERDNLVVNTSDSTRKKAADKSTSRYEKEKFLLLDIRGYRDYVEHMAKAANTSATKYIRNLIQMDMDKNMDIYEAHKALEEMLKGRSGN